MSYEAGGGLVDADTGRLCRCVRGQVGGCRFIRAKQRQRRQCMWRDDMCLIILHLSSSARFDLERCLEEVVLPLRTGHAKVRYTSGPNRPTCHPSRSRGLATAGPQ